jgi:hypothetical protein
MNLNEMGSKSFKKKIIQRRLSLSLFISLEKRKFKEVILYFYFSNEFTIQIMIFVRAFIKASSNFTHQNS